jgi:hypothetical protein
MRRYVLIKPKLTLYQLIAYRLDRTTQYISSFTVELVWNLHQLVAKKEETGHCPGGNMTGVPR